MKLVTILGARPQFIKAAPVSKALKQTGQREFILHTGQHYDYNMSQVFFDELQIPQPDVNLGIGSGPHGEQTARMLAGIEQVLIREKPDWVLVYGDTNSTRAGALAAVKLHVPLAHVEAGLRSFNRQMPEEHNRIETDGLADLLLAPDERSRATLEREGIRGHIEVVGDVMADACFRRAPIARDRSRILERLELAPGEAPLSGIRVLELTRVLAGPTAGRAARAPRRAPRSAGRRSRSPRRGQGCAGRRSARRGCRGRAAGRRSAPAPRCRCPSSGTARGRCARR